ncbi:hypothetical protein LJK88_04710 [Paenibacillus sp. P26]|nr:hypothetical protein LJK88_04710 [Paenibacillus sp. P26]
MMNHETAERLEYGKVKEKLEQLALSYLGKRHVQRLEPHTERRVIEKLLQEADEAVAVIRHGASVPIPSLDGMEPLMEGLGKGLLLSPAELSLIARMLESTEQLKRFMAKRSPSLRRSPPTRFPCMS